jgi:hypothetical protein
MPFQGNPNAGQPDPALLNLLFQEKNKREERAYQQQQDMLAAQRQAQLDAAEEARKERDHQVTVAGKLLDAQRKIRKEATALGDAQETARQQVGAVEKAAPVSPQAAPIVNGEDLPAGIFPLMPQDERNASMQLQAQDQYYGPVAAQQAAMANSISGIPELQSLQRVIPELGAQRFATKTRIDQEALQNTIDEETRKKIESDRVARRDDSIAAAGERRRARIAAQAETDKIKAREVELQTLSNKIASPKVAGQERELAESQYRAIKAEADAQLTANQAPEVVTELRKRANENFEYDLVYDQSRGVRGLIQRLESGDTKSIGTEAWASEVLGNFKNLVQTTSSMPFVDRYSSSLNAVLDNPANTSAEKQKIIDTYFSQENLDRVASGQLTEQEMQWWFMYSLNPDGRVSNMLAKDTQDNVQIIGPLVSPKLALSRLRAMANRQDQFLRRRRAYIGKVDKTEAFDPIDGRRVASESLPMPTTGGAAAPIKPGLSPKMSPEEAANAILGAPN